MLEDRAPEELELKVSDFKEKEPVEEFLLTPSSEEGSDDELILTLSPEEESEEVSNEELILTPSPEEEPDEELMLTLAPEEEHKGSEELILEAERIRKASEISFDGEDESEDRIRKAMEEYDAAMDAAAYSDTE